MKSVIEDCFKLLSKVRPSCNLPATTNQIFSVHCRKAGRPSKVISKELLQGLIRLKVPVSRIAEDLQVSRCRVYKAMAEYNLDETRYCSISEPDFQHAVSSIKVKHPNAGEVMLQGHLRAQGIHVPRTKLRKAIHDLQSSTKVLARLPSFADLSWKFISSLPSPQFNVVYRDEVVIARFLIPLVIVSKIACQRMFHAVI